MKSYYLKCVALLLTALLCMTSCSKEEAEPEHFTLYQMYRPADLPAFSTLQKDGKSYRPVHFIALEYGGKKLFRYEVYNNDAVNYYGLTGLSSIPGYEGWYYDKNAVTTISNKMERGKFTLEDGTVLEWVVSGDNVISALKDSKGTIKYVGWKYDEVF